MVRERRKLFLKRDDLYEADLSEADPDSSTDTYSDAGEAVGGDADFSPVRSNGGASGAPRSAQKAASIDCHKISLMLAGQKLVDQITLLSTHATSKSGWWKYVYLNELSKKQYELYRELDDLYEEEAAQDALRAATDSITAAKSIIDGYPEHRRGGGEHKIISPKKAEFKSIVYYNYSLIVFERFADDTGKCIEALEAIKIALQYLEHYRDIGHMRELTKCHEQDYLIQKYYALSYLAEHPDYKDEAAGLSDIYTKAFHLDLGRFINEHTYEGSGCELLMWLIREKRTDVLEKIQALKSSGVIPKFDPNVLDEGGNSPLLFAVQCCIGIDPTSKEVIRKLLSLGSDPKHMQDEEHNVLYYIEKQHKEHGFDIAQFPELSDNHGGDIVGGDQVDELGALLQSLGLGET